MDNVKDLKELNMQKGLFQKFADEENKLPNDARKEQMKAGLKASIVIAKKMKEQNRHKELPKLKKVVVNSIKLAQEIKSEMNLEEM